MSYSPIRTKRLQLRAPTTGDGAKLLPILSTDDVGTTLGMHATDESEASALIEQISGYSWVMVVVDSGEVVGLVLMSVDAASSSAEIGFAVGRAWRQRGFATEGVRAVTDYAFTQTSLARVGGRAVPTNVASIKVLTAVGLKRISERAGLGPSFKMQHGYSISRDEWDRLARSGN